MDIELWVYDLSRGLAKAMSRQFLGIAIDAVYHTSLVFNGIEYFYGAGVQTCYPGTSHHGQPMEKIQMGSTQLPLEVINDYLESLKAIYTQESYDLFAHNCNNFTNDFAMFLVGKGIPQNITNLPERVLDTPFGRQLKDQISVSMKGVTQAPVPPQNVPTQPDKPRSSGRYGRLVKVDSTSSLQKHLNEASNTAAVVFFTSATCPPCKIMYPVYDELAEQNPQVLFLKVDLTEARDVGYSYSIRATPTFYSYCKGVKKDEWSGADPRQLKANVERVINETFPPHAHLRLKVPTLQSGSLKPVVYSKVPPLEKLLGSLGDLGGDKDVLALVEFVKARSQSPKDAPLPDLQGISESFYKKMMTLPVGVQFAAVDLLRCAMVDPRVSGFCAEDAPGLMSTITSYVNGLEDCPRNLRLVTLHLCCNAFSSPLFATEVRKTSNQLASVLTQVIVTSLLETSHSVTRVAAATLAFNLTTSNYICRREQGHEGLAEEQQTELAVCLLEAMATEENADAAKNMLLALGYLVYCAPEGGEVLDVCHAVDARATVRKSKGPEALAREVSSLFNE
ncbi:DUF862-domain-containing protein [Piedraia hortae CBS 480.64]|uniref:DUF862-domain-containing protein n=1 Tax=Piedraia hortae CBS 480.64 TaxID=1314780 RepID=A0A6A7C752_9PEZI|nr:DUF862-domain-containing protein [Piedraia hortae CBS 480.64]